MRDSNQKITRIIVRDEDGERVNLFLHVGSDLDYRSRLQRNRATDEPVGFVK